MKKTTITEFFRFGQSKSPTWISLCYSIMLILVANFTQVASLEAASCTLACHNANISLGDDCNARLNVNTFVSAVAAPCPAGGPFQIIIKDAVGGAVLAQSGSLATNATIWQWTGAGAYMGRTVVVEIHDLASTNTCWSYALIEDKLPPVISSCADATINCWELPTWSPGFTEVCSLPITVTTVDINSRPGDCATEPGILRVYTRVFIAKDAKGNTSEPCTLKVFVRSIDLSTMLLCPPDYSIACGQFPVGTNPDPSLTGVPSILNAAGNIPLWTPGATNVACNVAVDYSDNILQLTCGRERKIMRTWRINAWNCGADQFFNCNQLITVRDPFPPSIACSGNVTLSTGAFNCTAPYVIPFPTVSDSCSTVSVDVVYTGGARTNMPREGHTVALPGGDNTITYRAYDNCGNQSTCSYVVTVNDLTKPVPVCIRNTVVALNEHGYGRLNAADLNSGSWDNCAIQKFAVRKMNQDPCNAGAPVFTQTNQHIYNENRTYLEFCCSETSTPVTVVLTVFDAAGNSNECMVVVDVQDKIPPVVQCPPDLTVDCRYPLDNVGGKYNEFGKVVGPGATRDSIFIYTEVFVYNPATGHSEPQRVRTFVGFDGWVSNGCVLRSIDVSVSTNLQCSRGTILRTFFVENGSGVRTSCTQKIVVTSRNAFFGYDAAVMTEASTTTNLPYRESRDEDVWEDECNFYYVTPVPPPPFPNVPTIQVKWKDWKHDIYWPGDITLINPCTSLPATCSNPTRGSRPQDTCALPFWAKKPYIPGDDRCSQVLLAYDDEEFRMQSGTANGCKKILRHWKVVDWCRRFCSPTPQGLYYIDGSAGYATWRYTQEIVIMNTVPPVVACEDRTVAANDNCVSADVVLTGTATDDCTDASELTWLSSLDIYNDGTYDVFGNGATITRNLPVGRHRVFWNVEDGCGNRSTKECYVTVVETKKPSPVCQALIAELMPTTGTITLNARGFNSHSFDNCTPENRLRFAYSSNINDTLRTFNCGDFCCSGGRWVNGVLAPTYLALDIWVFDENGNADFCKTGIMIQNNMGATCVPCQNNANCSTLLGRAVVGGSIQTENNRSVEQVTVNLEGGNSSVQTNVSGSYEFPAMNTGGSYKVIPQKNLLPTNGVSTQDILLIQKHILGAERLSTPYKMIAADVNKSGDITSADLVELRKLVLRKIENFTRNTSWRFVDKAYQFTTNNPASENFQEVYNISTLTGSMNNVEFVGVKIGDVNNTSQPSQLYNTEERSNNTYTLGIDEKVIQAGETIEIPVYTLNSGELNGMQFTLGLNPELVAFEGYTNGAITLQDDNFTFLRLNEGILATSWDNKGAASFVKGQVLFSLKLKALKTIQVSEAINMNSQLVSAEAYSENNTKFNLELQLMNKGNAVASKLELFQNQPNPWDKFTSISFNLPEAVNASVTIYDVSGRVLKTVKQDFNKGFNQIDIDSRELSANGVLYYELKTPMGTATKKMILLNK